MDIEKFLLAKITIAVIAILCCIIVIGFFAGVGLGYGPDLIDGKLPVVESMDLGEE